MLQLSMTHFLALDIGRKHTGIAFADENIQVPLPLDTIHHDSGDELISAIETIAKERGAHTLVIGLPLLPDGSEGEECEHVRKIAEALSDYTIEFIDERLTSAVSKELKSDDADAQAAVSILQTYLDRQGCF